MNVLTRKLHLRIFAANQGESRPKSSAVFAPLTPVKRRLLNAATDIMTNQAKQIDFLHSVQCQTILPYRNPGDHVREWDRRQGNATLRIEAGSALNPKTNEYVHLGLPYGEMPRLVLIHLASEAVRTNSPIIDVEGSLTAFARSLGIDTSGPQLRHLKSQLTRLANATVRMGFIEQGHAIQVNTQIVAALDLWEAEPSQQLLWPSTVRLSSDFFAEKSDAARSRWTNPHNRASPPIAPFVVGSTYTPAGPADAPRPGGKVCIHSLWTGLVTGSVRAGLAPASAISAAASLKRSGTSTASTLGLAWRRTRKG